MSRNRTAPHTLRAPLAAPVGDAAGEAFLEAATRALAGGREPNDPWD